MINLNNTTSNIFIVYAWSFTPMLVGECSFEKNGGYVVIETRVDAINEDDAKEKIANKYGISLDELEVDQISV